MDQIVQRAIQTKKQKTKKKKIQILTHKKKQKNKTERLPNI